MAEYTVELVNDDYALVHVTSKNKNFTLTVDHEVGKHLQEVTYKVAIQPPKMLTEGKPVIDAIISLFNPKNERMTLQLPRAILSKFDFTITVNPRSRIHYIDNDNSNMRRSNMKVYKSSPKTTFNGSIS
jgi:hypothetical protein